QYLRLSIRSDFSMPAPPSVLLFRSRMAWLGTSAEDVLYLTLTQNHLKWCQFAIMLFLWGSYWMG
ncbi:MAG: hypothetical protein M0022_01600, partial [Desulfobacteraceae bacterium]|nr:hypothetical protein [Desulfobacteraceae bacterium]